MSEQATRIEEQITGRLRDNGDQVISVVKEHNGYSSIVVPGELRINIYRHDKYDNQGQRQEWATQYEVTIMLGKTLVTSFTRRPESVRDLIVKVLQNLW
jgi:hypothetical protein